MKCELQLHIPFTLFSAVVALALAGVFIYLGRLVGQSPKGVAESAEPLFHILHPCHLLASAMATTAMFRRYEQSLWKAAVIGLLGALIFCQISDILLPYLGGKIMGQTMELHVELLHHPDFILVFLGLGIAGGLVAARGIRYSTVYSHSGHVFVSTVASLSYLVSYGFTQWYEHLSVVVIVLFIAVWVPCCFSDIVFPLMLGSAGKEAEHEEHLHLHRHD